MLPQINRLSHGSARSNALAYKEIISFATAVDLDKTGDLRNFFNGNDNAGSH